MNHHLNQIRKVGLKFSIPIKEDEPLQEELKSIDDSIEIEPARVVKNTGRGVNMDKHIKEKKKPTKVKRIITD